MAADDNVLVKKVKPYPFVAQLTHGGSTFQGNVVKLVMHGFMMDLGAVVVHVGEIYGVQFELPVLHQVVAANVKAIKTYDKYQASAESKARRLAEFHFVHPSTDVTTRVKNFLAAIKQTGSDLA